MYEITVNDRTILRTTNRTRATKTYKSRINRDGRRGRIVTLYRNGIERRMWDGWAVGLRLRELVGEV